MTTAHLPLELIDQIASYCNTVELRNLRLVSNAFAITTERWLFREVILYPRVDSAIKYVSILESGLNKRVKEVRWDLRGERTAAGDSPWIRAVFGHPSWDAIARVIEFPNIVTIRIDFSHQCYDAYDHNESIAAQTIHFRYRVLNFLFRELSFDKAHKIRHLVLGNLQNSNLKIQSILNRRSSRAILARLHTLQMDVTDEKPLTIIGDEFYPLRNPVHRRFWSQVPQMWLAPTQNCLRSLRLCSSINVGFVPPLNLNGIHFPHLQSLALGNWTIFRWSQVQWILDHSETLQEIALCGCEIVFAAIVDCGNAEDGYARTENMYACEELELHMYQIRWHQIFRSLEKYMSKLCRLSISPSRKSYDDPFDETTRFSLASFRRWSRYVAWSEGNYTNDEDIGEQDLAKVPKCGKDDLRVLARLMFKLGQITSEAYAQMQVESKKLKN